jgi:hypothetical protein
MVGSIPPATGPSQVWVRPPHTYQAAQSQSLVQGTGVGRPASDPAASTTTASGATNASRGTAASTAPPESWPASGDADASGPAASALVAASMLAAASAAPAASSAASPRCVQPTDRMLTRIARTRRMPTADRTMPGPRRPSKTRRVLTRAFAIRASRSRGGGRGRKRCASGSSSRVCGCRPGARGARSAARVSRFLREENDRLTLALEEARRRVRRKRCPSRSSRRA